MNVDVKYEDQNYIRRTFYSIKDSSINSRSFSSNRHANGDSTF